MPPLRATAPPGVGAGTTGGGGVRKGRRPDIRAVKRPAPSGVGGGPLADSIRATRQHPRCCPGRARLSSLDAGPISNGLGLREPHGGGGVAWSEESGRGHIEVAGDPGGGRGGQSQRTRRERGVLGFGPALVDVMGRYQTHAPRSAAVATARRDGTGVDLTGVRHLPENAGVAFMGDTKGGPFDVAGDQAREWLRLPANPNGRTNADVL